MRKGGPQAVFAVYRGDEFVDVGAAEGLSARVGIAAGEIARKGKEKGSRKGRSIRVFLIKVNCKEENE